MNVAPIFINEKHQATFDRQGFVIIPDFLLKEEVIHMDRFFDEMHPNLPNDGFFAGSYSPDMAYKQKVSKEIKHIYHRAYETFFKDYTPFGGAFLFKMPSENSDLFIHQDWTVVDESKHLALNIWVPLCDINMENGALMVIPGSHFANYPTLRAPTMRYFFDHDIKTTMQQLEPIIVKAGTAVVLNQSLVHYSPPNRSGTIRKAITSGLKTKDAQMIFHFSDPQKPSLQIENFEVGDDFFIQFDDFFSDIYKRPIMGRSIGNFEYSVPMLSGIELKDQFGKMRISAGFSPVEYPEKNIEMINRAEVSFFKTYTPKNMILEVFGRIRKLF
ncbi:MAG: hypothetical protein RL308_3233 [Bacteroidota bacterium]|jgi:hypothetical protein